MKGFSQELAVDFAMDISQAVPLAPHYEEENAIAFSMFVNDGVAAEGLKETSICGGYDHIFECSWQDFVPLFLWPTARPGMD